MAQRRKAKWLSLPIFAALATAPLIADDAAAQDSSSEKSSTPAMTKEQLTSKDNIEKLSETYGHFIAKSLDSPVLKLVSWLLTIAAWVFTYKKRNKYFTLF